MPEHLDGCAAEAPDTSAEHIEIHKVLLPQQAPPIDDPTEISFLEPVAEGNELVDAWLEWLWAPKMPDELLTSLNEHLSSHTCIIGHLHSAADSAAATGAQCCDSVCVCLVHFSACTDEQLHALVGNASCAHAVHVGCLYTSDGTLK